MSDNKKKIYYDGYVGIGTENPDQPLTIAGEAGTYLTIKADNGEHVLSMGADTGGGIVSSMKDHDLQLRAGNNDTKLTIKNNGNVGIGTTNPQSKIHVSGGSLFQGGRNYFTDDENKGRLRVGAAWGIPGIYSEDGQDVIVGTGGGNQVLLGCAPNFMLVKGNGNVEVNGSIAIGHRWDGAVKNQDINIGKPDGTGTWGAGAAFIRFKDVAGSTGEINAGTNICFHPHAWGVAPKEAMIIAANGNVGIGKSDPAYKLDVNGDIRGNMVTPSDIRLKENIEPVNDALDKISALQGVSYTLKDKEQKQGRQIGLIAQHVEKVVPEIVSTDNNGFKSLAYDRLTALLIESVKELRAENVLLRERLARLEKISVAY